MIQGFVTVGTTAFDSLVRALDKPSDLVRLEFQIADGSIVPSNHSYHRFIKGIDRYLANADFIVTHAGAGTVYKLLEMARPSVAVVPNLDRADPHQTELATFVAQRRYACVLSVQDLGKMSLGQLVRLLQSFQPQQYAREHFFKCEEILRYLVH